MNGIVNSGFMATPPIEEAPIDNSTGRFTDMWKNHFDTISQTLGLVIGHDRLNNAEKQETPVTIIIAMFESDRDLLENAIDGTILYNKTTNRFNFRENGAWVTFTPIAA